MTTTTRRAVRLMIEGRVQGVGFRAFVAREATARALDGWVRNRRDGRVEAVIAGPHLVVEEMIARCHEGPSFSRVERVHVAACEEDDITPEASGFAATTTV